MAGKPQKEQNPEAVELIDKLREKLNCRTDGELAEKLGINRTHISRWRNRGLTDVVKGFIFVILDV